MNDSPCPNCNDLGCDIPYTGGMLLSDSEWSAHMGIKPPSGDLGEFTWFSLPLGPNNTRPLWKIREEKREPTRAKQRIRKCGVKSHNNRCREIRMMPDGGSEEEAQKNLAEYIARGYAFEEGNWKDR